jgi:hypothetical protein
MVMVLTLRMMMVMGKCGEQRVQIGVMVITSVVAVAGMWFEVC